MAAEIGIRALQQTASKVVSRVEAGETITVTDRGRPVARMVPMADSMIEHLIATRALRPSRLDWAAVPAPIPADGTPVTDLLWAAREGER